MIFLFLYFFIFFIFIESSTHGRLANTLIYTQYKLQGSFFAGRSNNRDGRRNSKEPKSETLIYSKINFHKPEKRGTSSLGWSLPWPVAYYIAFTCFWHILLFTFWFYFLFISFIQCKLDKTRGCFCTLVSSGTLSQYRLSWLQSPHLERLLHSLLETISNLSQHTFRWSLNDYPVSSHLLSMSLTIF